MNKKGFTILELLAVIIILSILSLAVIPDTVKYLQRSENDYNVGLKNQLELSAKNYYADYKENLPVKGIDEIGKSISSYVTALELSTNKYLSKDLIDSDGRNCNKNSYVKVTIPEGKTEEEWHTCLICEDENGEKDYSDDPMCKVDENQMRVDIIVNGGTTESSNYIIEKDKKLEVSLTPLSENSVGTVTCTNNQEGMLENNNLIINKVTNDTICTVTYNQKAITTLYKDGTLIINELSEDRPKNIQEHNEVEKEYEPLSDSNNYVMTEANDQPWKNERESITDVEIGSNISPTSTAYWFSSLINMKFGDFTKLDTSNVTSMHSMFGAKHIDYAFNADHIFEGTGKNALSFNLIGLSNWDVSKVTDMDSMFNYAGYNATTWSIGNLSNWNVSNVTNMGYIFQDAGYKATTWSIGNLSNWDVSKVTDMRWLFYYAGYNATTWSIGNLSNWDVSNVTDINRMFYKAGYKTATFDIGNLSNWDVSKVTDMSAMFSGAGYSATTWTVGDLSNWDVSKVTDMSWMFNDAGHSATTWTIGDLSNWDVSKVTDMKWLFDGAGKSATTFELDLSNWNVSNVTDMSYMFYEVGESATTFELDLSNWNVSNVTNMSLMFAYTGESATTFDIGNLSDWNVSKVTNMESMFRKTGRRASNATLKITNWNPTSVTNTSSMFEGSGFKTIYCNYDWQRLNKITNSTDMFEIAYKLVGGNNTAYNGSNPTNKTYARPDEPAYPGYFTKNK